MDESEGANSDFASGQADGDGKGLDTSSESGSGFGNKLELDDDKGMYQPAPPSFTSSYYVRGRDREDEEHAMQTEVKSPFEPSVCRTFPYIGIMGST